jgi:hypothetical protein
VLLLTESPALDRCRERLPLFENLPDHNPPRELKGRRRFPYFLVRNPLKSLDSEK